MQIPVENIKAAILHPDQEVREEAVFYFARAYSPDPTIMPLVIQAIERFGLDTFITFNYLSSLVQTDGTVAWLIQEIERADADPDGDASYYVRDLVATLCGADPAVLKRQEAEILAMRGLDASSQEVIASRILVSSLGPEALWRELAEFCEEQETAEEDASYEAYQYVSSVVETMSRYPGHFADRVLAILNSEADELSGWLEGLVIQLAGDMKLEAAIPPLVDRLEAGDDWACDQAHEALAKIGTAAVVREIAGRYAGGDWEFRRGMAMVLEDNHTELSVQTGLDLFAEEQDVALRAGLLQAVLANCSPAGIEPARQFLMDHPGEPGTGEVRRGLLIACKLLGETFPEYEAWREAMQADEESLRQWIKDHPLDLADDEEFGGEEYDVEDSDLDYLDDDDGLGDFGEFEAEDDEQPTTIVRRASQVGRNDPCPCGSGKKYKKCCYRTGDFVEQTDEEHSAAMSIIGADKLPATYPIGTIAIYGPDDTTTTKIVAGVITREGAEPILERWVGSKIRDNPKARRQMEAFFDRHKVKSVVAAEENMGCPHEEGLDFPLGEDCPFCPFWAGKQGSSQWE